MNHQTVAPEFRYIRRLSKRWIFLIMLPIVCMFTAANAQSSYGNGNMLVHNIDALNAAISKAKPGEVISLADGVWQNAIIDLKAKATADAPVIVRAQTPGKVILSGDSRIIFSSAYDIADGFCFKNGTPSSGNVIDFRADYCQLKNTAIIDYNPADRNEKYYWIYFKGSHDTVSHCYFTGKSNLDPLVGNHIVNARYNTVDSCYFKDIPYWPHNGREMFRIWGYGGNDYDHLSKNDGAYFTVAYNLFDHADGEGMEIVSLKSNNDKVIHNTILGSRGGIVNRSGNYNLIADNYIDGENLPDTKGIRVSGRGHRVINNYVARVSGIGLEIRTGEYIEKYLTKDYQPVLRKSTRLGRVPMYSWVKNSLFANNTFINNKDVDIYIGTEYKASWPHRQMVLIPENNIIRHNKIYEKDMGTAILITRKDSRPPLDRFSFQPNTLEHNILYGSRSLKVQDGENNEEADTTLDGIKKLPYEAPPLRKAPLTPADVGPSWMRDLQKAADIKKPQPIRPFLQPAVKDGGFSMKGYFLWCSSVIKVGDTYNLFASRWPAKYGMGGWTKYSEVVRATSQNLYGPYQFQEVVLKKRKGYWDNDRAHNPRVVKVGDTYVLYYISSANETGYAYAKSISGPWTRMDHYAMPFSNPAPLVNPDGSIYVFGRKSVNNIRIAQAYTAPAFNAKYALLNHGKNLLPGSNQLEDPTIWKAGGFYNVICSDFRGDATGVHKAGAQYYSTDGIHYQPVTNQPVYTKTVTFADHSQEKFKRRERPFAYVDDKGEVTALFTACLPENGPSRIVVQPVDHYKPEN